MDCSPAAVPSASVFASSVSATAMPRGASALQQLDQEQIKKAVEVLFTQSKSRKNNNGLLLNENDNLFLMVILWKIPEKELRVRLSLPHNIRSHLSEICLFTKDECESPEQTERFFKKQLKKHGVKTISRIIPFQTLKKEYKAYEAKLNLLSSFEFFITDERIRRLLPTHIGKHFYQRKKVPVPVNLLAKNLSKEINDCISGTVLNISKSGSCSTIRIGHTGMETQHIIENILAVSKKLSEILPEKWQSVKLLFLKTEKSVSLPIFSSFVTCQDEKNISFRSLKKKVKRKYHEKQKLKNRSRMLGQKAKTDASVPLQGGLAPKTGAAPVKGPGSQKKKTGKAKAQPKVIEQCEEEIPQLIPIGESPAKENVKMQKDVTERKTPKKSPGPNTPHSKKRKALSAVETPESSGRGTPGNSPGKKRKMEQEKEKTSSLQTPKKPEARFFATPRKSAKKATSISQN
uniref:Ribosomal L1 domain-containing protein 1 n=1 Tax=Nannospalax galili TaxID=1026970 RepID=A0A8C6W3Z9_NANGA